MRLYEENICKTLIDQADRKEKEIDVGLKNVFLLFSVSSAGGSLQQGVYAFLAIIGVFVRTIGKRRRKSILCFMKIRSSLEECLETSWSFIVVRLPLGRGIWADFFLTGGVSVGIFTGCLVMSLAETLKALPTFSRRIRLSVDFPWSIAAIAAVKVWRVYIIFLEKDGSRMRILRIGSLKTGYLGY